MGNCLVLQGRKVMRVMKADVDTIKHQPPSKLRRPLSGFPVRTTSDELPVVRYVDPVTGTRSKKHRSSKGDVGPRGVRIKLVVSKEELKEILRKGGVSLDGMVCRPRREPSKGGEGDEQRCIGWRPALESIPEENDIY